MKTINDVLNDVDDMSYEDLEKLGKKIKGLQDSRRFIENLQDEFFIPNYQRGYKWTNVDVENLILDIEAFGNEQNDNVYCLQPLIVVKNDGKFEVIDGQQRLTTIYLLLKILDGNVTFKIEYETRKKLDDMINNNFAPQTQDEFYIKEAIKTIKEHFNSIKDNKKREEAKAKFVKTLKERVFFIFHKLNNSQDKENVFSKINVGKIPLTNAELIKALLLSENNFDEVKQNVFSQRWNMIEQQLQNNDFWFFISQKNDTRTRIDLPLELCAEDYNKKEKLKLEEKDPRFAFNVYSKMILKTDIQSLWQNLEDKFECLLDLYNDRTLYHLIGYLIAIDDKRRKILEIVFQNKSEAEQELKNRIKEKLDYDNLDITKLDFNLNKPLIKKVLLLHNVVTILNQNDGKFNFYKYKNIGWDVEHIIARDINKQKQEAGEQEDGEDEINNISNLCLLSYEMNRNNDYKNAQFDYKRKLIKDWIKEGEYVLICTQRVFTKFYDETDLNNWTKEDKKQYISAIVNDLDTFFKGEQL